MNVLESVLVTSDAEEYSDNFANYSIDAQTLKILTDEDLKVIGVDDENKRKLILEHTAALQLVGIDQPINVLVDEEYIERVLRHMSAQLTKHLASLSIAANRDDVIVCDLRLSPGTKCLQNSLKLLEAEIKLFEQTVTKTRKPPKRNPIYVPALLTAACSALICFKVYSYLSKN